MAGKYLTNKLNGLTGREWIKFTKSWFVHNPPPREERKMLHPAPFPETLVQEFIEFFTKKGERVLDPFLGTASTLVACQKCMRRGVGIEIVRKYAEIAEERLRRQKLSDEDKRGTEQVVLAGDARKIVQIFKKNKLSKMDFCITSPPYWNQLKRNWMRQKERGEVGLDTYYSDNPKEIGNIDDYKKFIREQRHIFDRVYEVMKDNAYLVVITNNVFYEGRVYPLAFDTFTSLSKRWVPKDEKIWLQNDKPLLPLGIYSAWVGNRCHQYCLIFRKEPVGKKDKIV